MIRTERLLLRPLCRDDLEHIQRYAVRPDYYRYLPIPEQTPESVAAFLEARLAEDAATDKKTWLFAIETHEVGHMIGIIRLTIVNAYLRTADTGYGMDSDFYGHGYMTEAVKAILGFGFRELQLHRIWATADVQNEPSCRLSERVAMRRKGLPRQDKPMRGPWSDSYLYAILDSDLQ